MTKKLVVGAIPDGNRTWASDNNVPLSLAYRQAAHKVVELICWCQQHPIEHLYIYGASKKNVEKRPPEIIVPIIEGFLELIKIKEEKKDLGRVDYNFIGDMSAMPISYWSSLSKLERRKSKKDSKLNVSIVFNYSVEWDVGESSYRYRKTCDFPEMDIIFRTGSVKRLSNFLPLQTSYAELFFLEKNWPEIDKGDFNKILNEFGERVRMFGS